MPHGPGRVYPPLGPHAFVFLKFLHSISGNCEYRGEQLKRLRCPNCGRSRFHIIGQEQAGTPRPRGLARPILVSGVLAALLAVAAGQLVILLDQWLVPSLFSTVTTALYPLSFYGGLAAGAAALWMLASVLVLAAAIRRTRTAVERYHLECFLCGYLWSWEPGRSWPPVQAPPGRTADAATYRDGAARYEEWLAYKQAETRLKREGLGDSETGAS